MFDELARRELLKKSGVLAMGMLAWPAWMPRVALRASAAQTKSDTLVAIFMRGGVDGQRARAVHQRAGAERQPDWGQRLEDAGGAGSGYYPDGEAGDEKRISIHTRIPTRTR